MTNHTIVHRAKPKLKQSSIEFIDFIRQKGVMGLAIGIIIGAAVTVLVQSLVNDIINPLIGLVLPKADRLADSTWHFFEAEIRWGSFVLALLNFAVIALVVFIGFKVLRLDQLDKKKSQD